MQLRGVSQACWKREWGPFPAMQAWLSHLSAFFSPPTVVTAGLAEPLRPAAAPPLHCARGSRAILFRRRCHGVPSTAPPPVCLAVEAAPPRAAVVTVSTGSVASCAAAMASSGKWWWDKIGKRIGDGKLTWAMQLVRAPTYTPYQTRAHESRLSLFTLPNTSSLHCIRQSWASLAPDSSQARVSRAANHTLCNLCNYLLCSLT
jgi:hypothetical protein